MLQFFIHKVHECEMTYS